MFLCFLMEHEIFGDEDCTWFNFHAHYHEQFETHGIEETKSRKASHVFSQLSFPFKNLHGCHWNIGLGKMLIWVFHAIIYQEKPEQAFWPTQYLHVKQYQDFRVTLVLGMWLAPSCWISVLAKRLVEGTQCLSGSLQPWWQVGKQGERVHGLRQKHISLRYSEIESEYFKLLWGDVIGLLW